MNLRASPITLNATLIVLMLISWTIASAASDNVVSIDSGRLAGVVEGDVVSFRGVPFAAPPVGDLRWRAPQRANAWQGIRRADRFGPVCQQRINPADNGVGSQPASEDCLTLNVWAPATRNSSKLPVMLWIHGGGYVAGSGTAELYDGTRLAEQGVVVVTINYRLGRFGFFAHPALTRENPAGPLGNYGLMDQIAALEWIARNIAAFGGDSSNVTIFGESAGGAAVNRLMISPAARGLFHRAISQSGLGRERSPHLNRTGANGMPSGEAQGSAFAASIGLTDGDAAALRAIPAEKIVAGGDPNPMWGGGPIIDGKLLRDDVADAFADGAQARVPYLLGSNALELPGVTPTKPWLFGEAFELSTRERTDLIKAYGTEEDFNSNIFSDVFFTEPARALARFHARVGAPAYLYRFSVLSDSVRDKFKGAPHASERQYVFRTLNASPWPTGPMDERAAETMSACWVAFATTGDPNRSGRPGWPVFSEAGNELLRFTNDGPLVETIADGPVLDAIAELYRLEAPSAAAQQRGDSAGPPYRE